LAYVASRSIYDPIAEELNGYAETEETALTREEWDGIARLCLGVEGEYEGEVLRKWLIGCVARVFEPGCKVDQALILKGVQNAGKSTLFRELGGAWFTDSLGDLSNEKDDRLIISRYWICEWSECDQVFAGARKAEKIKQVVTAQTDVFRAPYGRTPDSHPRRSVLVGTTNRDDFLNDHTGNRRFPVIEVKQTNTEWITANRPRIWARAVAEYRAGTPWWFSREQEAEITRKALAYAPENEAIDQVHEFLKIHPGRWFNTREIAELALQRDPERIDQKDLNRLSRDLQRLTAFGVEVERRFHIAPNPRHGKGSKNCFRLPPERSNA
jgi:predicted P-loop ATPase